MDKQLEDSINRTIALGMQQIRMMFVEANMAKAKQDNEINDEQYDTFRQVADRHWGKWSKKVKRLSRK